MNIYIDFIPHKTHRYTTIGYWRFVREDLYITISQEICWQNKIAVLFHELIEAVICKANGITTEECDSFDDLFEKEYEEGKWPKSVEAGFDKRCPYRKGHVWGTRFEKVVIWLMGADKKELDRECDELMGV